MADQSAYVCAFNGQCEFDLYGVGYSTQAECEEQCRGRENKEINYEIYTYAPSEAIYLAPSDRREIIRRITGVTLHSDTFTQEILYYLGQENVAGLAYYFKMHPYLLRTYTPQGLVELLTKQADITAVSALGYLNLPYDAFTLAVNLLQNRDAGGLSELLTFGKFKYDPGSLLWEDLAVYLEAHPQIDPGPGIVKLLAVSEGNFQD